jgi:hypothetical protein
MLLGERPIFSVFITVPFWTSDALPEKVGFPKRGPSGFVTVLLNVFNVASKGTAPITV